MLPRVATIGMCVTRDPFSRRFAPNYKQRAKLVSYAYQTSFLSLVRTRQIHIEDLPNTLLPHHVRYIEQELRGNILEGLFRSKPDIIVIDVAAEVHFGVTTLAGLLTTRNHMAFSSTEAATAFYEDDGWVAPLRLRFDGGDTYTRLLKTSLEVFIEQVEERLPSVQLVLNSARYATTYLDYNSSIQPFANSERLNQKNKLWNEVLVGSAFNPWGLNPVHYTGAYYEYFWDEMARIVNV
jgi:hypothetical protein